MKIGEFFNSMLSDDSKVSSKRVVGFGTWLLFVSVVVVHLVTKMIIQGEILYAMEILIVGCFGLNALVDYKAFSKNKAKDNFLKKETDSKDGQVIKETLTKVTNTVNDDSPLEGKSQEKVVVQTEVIKQEPVEIEDADILDGLKENFKKPTLAIPTKPKNLLEAGSFYIGVTEVNGADSNKAILEFAKKADIDWYVNDDTAWCAVFVNAMCDIVGLKETKSALAKSFLTWGHKISINDAIEDSANVIAIFHRGSPNSSSGHVGILKQINSGKETAQILGGNQSDKVCIQNFKLDDKFITFRRGVVA